MSELPGRRPELEARRSQRALVGFAAAGGRSKRMGEDKAALGWSRGDLLDHAIARLRQLTPDVRILCGPVPRYADRGCPVLADAVFDVGGLAALVTALRALPGGARAVLLAVDLPLAGAPVLEHLLELSPGFDAVVPCSGAGAEPFCALYAQTCRPAVEHSLAAGRLKMTAFWPDVRVREVPAAEIDRFGPPDEVFLNVNTRADYERARALAGLDKG